MTYDVVIWLLFVVWLEAPLRTLDYSKGIRRASERCVWRCASPRKIRHIRFIQSPTITFTDTAPVELINTPCYDRCLLPLTPPPPPLPPHFSMHPPPLKPLPCSPGPVSTKDAAGAIRVEPDVLPRVCPARLRASRSIGVESMSRHLGEHMVILSRWKCGIYYWRIETHFSKARNVFSKAVDSALAILISTSSS